MLYLVKLKGETNTLLKIGYTKDIDKRICLLLGVAGGPGSQVFELSDKDTSNAPRIL